MDNNKQVTKRLKNSSIPESLSIFSVEILSNAAITFHINLNEQELLESENLEKYAEYLAFIVFQYIKTPLGLKAYSYITELLEVSTHTNAAVFKYKFETKLYEFQKRQTPVVPASKVFGP
jgi:hypothetical protein